MPVSALQLLPWRRLAVALVLALSLLWSASVAQSATAQQPVYLLNAVYSTLPFAQDEAKAVWAGMNAAFFNAQYKTAGGRPITIIEPDFTAADASDIQGVIGAALKTQPDLLGVLGPFTDTSLVAVLSNTTLRDSGLMFLGPLTGSSTVRQWSDAVYFTRADPQTELLVIMAYILNVIRARRIAFMYFTGAWMGPAEYRLVQLILAGLSREPAARYVAQYDAAATTVNQTAFDEMADTRPQVVILWGVPGFQTQAFLETLLSDPRTSSVRIATPFAFQGFFFQSYYTLAQRGILTPRNDQVFASATSFPVTFTSARHIALFRQEMINYIETSTSFDSTIAGWEVPLVDAYGNLSDSQKTGSSGTSFLATHPNTAQLMLTGWLTAKVVLQTLAQPTWTTDRTAYKTGLFDQNRYVIGGDFVLGDYGGECDAISKSLGAMCECNQGGRSAFLTALQDAAWVMQEQSMFTYSHTDCYLTLTKIARPVNVLTIYFQDYPELVEIGKQFSALVSPVLSSAVSNAFQMNFASLDATTETAQATFDAYIGDFTVDISMCPMTISLDIGDVFLPSPVFPHPHLVMPKRNYIYLMPTLEQEMYMLYSNLDLVRAVMGVSTSTNVVLRGYPQDEAASITALLYRTAGTFNVPNPTISSIAFATSLSGSFKAGTVNYLIGMADGDDAFIASFLTANPQAVVIVCFDDLSVYYDGLVEALRGAAPAVQRRFLAFNSLPLWTDTSDAAHAASPVLANFHAKMPNATYYTPSLLRDFVVSDFIQVVVADTTVVNATTLADTVYRNAAITSDGMSYGPFSWGCTETSVGEECAYVNYGAQNLVITSMERVLNPTVPVTVPARTPAMVYTPRAQPGLTTAELRGIIAGCVVGGVLLIAAVALLVYCCTDSRDNDAAPKSHREPVTLIFTDIESSTAMWATLPQLMADAIAAHHRVIRQLIKKYGCYEVKTVGDSFMIACKDAYSAVQLACDIQRKLLKYDWGTTEIDSKYREFERAKLDTVDGYVPPTARLSAEEYAALWAGLRVRIGIHTGLSDIRYDEVTKGYDYYGDTSNMAARTEAIANGGQVVATETTWWALSDEERDAIKCTEMGPQGLRGVPFAVEMYQLNAVPGRTHAALRTEIDAILPDDGADETSPSAADALLSSAGTMTGAAAGIAVVIGGCFAPYPVAQRVRELQPLLNKWGIGAPPRPRQVGEEDYCQGLINRLAIRVANITQARRNMTGADPLGERMSTLGSAVAGNPLQRTSLAGGLHTAASAMSDFHAMQAHRPPLPHMKQFRRSVGSGTSPPQLPPPQVTSTAATHAPVTTDPVVPFSPPHSSFGDPELARGCSSVFVVEVRMPQF